MKKRAKKRRRQALRAEVDKWLKPETEQARLWKKLGTIDLSKAFKHEADR